MLIRRVEERDMDQLIDLCALHAVYEKSEYDRLNKKDRLHNQLFTMKDSLQCIVAESQGKLLGYVTFIKQYSTWDADHYVYLDCIYLKEESRGRGIGSKLMQLVKAYAEQQNCFQVQWQTPDFNDKAIKFYHNLGAVSKTKERFFWS